MTYEVEDGVPIPAKADKPLMTKADLLRNMTSGQSFSIGTKQEVNVFRATAHKVLGPGAIIIEPYEGEWRLWRK